MATIHLAIGTKNPAKIKAARQAFKKLLPQTKIILESIEAISRVSSQPMSAPESIQGATNRAKQALNLHQAIEYGIGLEGGLEQIEGTSYDCGWCVIINRKGEQGVASSARIETPASIMSHIKQGKELGDAIDTIFNRTNVKQAEGHFGLMTNNAITRTDGYVQAVCLAFSRFLHPEVF